MAHKYRQGFFRPKFPKKYKGDPNNIVYRSAWEAKMMHWLDMNSNVTRWSSEETIVPYIHPADGKYHRYFVDFWAEIEGKRQILIEVKPRTQIDPPKVRKKRTAKSSAKYMQEAETWAVNKAKWQAAEEFCQKKGMQFLILDEYDIGVKSK